MTHALTSQAPSPLRAERWTAASEKFGQRYVTIILAVSKNTEKTRDLAIIGRVQSRIETAGTPAWQQLILALQ